MKDELRRKYMPPSFSAYLMDEWYQYTQGNKLTKKYVTKFDKFLIRYNTLNVEGQDQILFRFKVGLRGNLRTELLVRGITELKATHVLVQDLDSLGLITTLGVLIQNQMRLELHPLNSSIGLIPKISHIGMTSRTRVLNGTTKAKAPRFPKLVPQPNATNVKDMDI